MTLSISCVRCGTGRPSSERKREESTWMVWVRKPLVLHGCAFINIVLRNNNVPGTSGRLRNTLWLKKKKKKSPAAVTGVVTSAPATTSPYWALQLPCVRNAPKECDCVCVCTRPCVLALPIVFTATRPAICSEAQTQLCVLFEGCCSVWPAPPSSSTPSTSLAAPPQSPVSPQLSGGLSNSEVLFGFQWGGLGLGRWAGVWVECPVLCVSRPPNTITGCFAPLHYTRSEGARPEPIKCRENEPLSVSPETRPSNRFDLSHATQKNQSQDRFPFLPLPASIITVWFSLFRLITQKHGWAAYLHPILTVCS